MNGAMTIGAAALVAAAVAAGTAVLLNDDGDKDRVDGGVDAAAIVALEERMREHEDDLARLREDARRATPERAASPAVLDEGRIEAIVRRVLAERGEAPTATKGDAGPAGAADLDVEDLVAQLMQVDLPYQDRERILTRLNKAGRLDEAIALLEKRAKIEASNPDAQVRLANAYIAKLTGGNLSQQEVSMLANKAMDAYDRALELDDTHWEARFSKAMSLSFWPPVLGKQPEAIRNFEILVEQQAHQQPHEGFAQTHLLLGNMYMQQGNAAKAKEAWRRGLEAFPDDEDLKAQLQAAGD